MKNEDFSIVYLIFFLFSCDDQFSSWRHRFPWNHTYKVDVLFFVER